MIQARRISVEEPAFNDVLYIRWRELDIADGYSLPTEPSTNDKNPRTIHIAAFDNHRVIGTVRIDPGEGDHDALVRRMAVVPDMRRRGIGRGVLKLAEILATFEQKIQTFHLNAKQDAVPFYEAEGYVLTGEEYLWPPDAENAEVHYVMVKGEELSNEK